MPEPATNEPGPDTSIHWVDGNATPRDPVSADILRGWIEGGHLPPDTPVWWEGQPDWGPASERMALGATTESDATTGAPDGAASPDAEPDPQSATEAPIPSPSEEPPPAEDPPPVDAARRPDPAPAPLDAPQPLDVSQPMAAPAPMAPSQAPGHVPTPQPAQAHGQPAAAQPAPASALAGDVHDQELDDTFMGLVSRSYELYKETERATSVDEAFLGGVIAAFGDSGYVLIDIFTGGAAASSGTTSATAPTLPASSHQLRFEDPNTGARVALRLDHLTPDVGSAKLLGQQARIEVGYGERIPNFGQVGRALRQEVASNFIVSTEPGRVSFDADLSSGFVYCEVDLLWELDRYVDEALDIDADLLKLHLASMVHTLHKFLRLRFTN